MTAVENDADVIVVGAGPGGSATAYHLARHGVRVLLLEKTEFPREKVCGDGLTPRAVRQLIRMGVDTSPEAGWLHNKGLRVIGGGVRLELDWPDLASFPNYGLVRTRLDFDDLLAQRAVAAGAKLRTGVNVLTPVLDADDRVIGVQAEVGPDKEPATFHAPLVVAADGVSGRFPLALGLTKREDRPIGVAVRRYYRSPAKHDDDYLESWLELRAKGNDALLPGYGWIFGLGDGRVNVGLGVLNSSSAFGKTNYRRLAHQSGWPSSSPVVRLAERGGGVEHAQADVHPAVAEAEDPAVAGQQRVVALGPQLQPGLQVVVVVLGGRAVVAADRDADRPVLPLGQPEREREAAGDPVGGDHQRRVEGGRLLVRADLGLHADHPVVRVQHRGQDVHPGAQLRAGGDGTLGEQVVEVEPGPDQAVVGEAGQSGQSSSRRTPPPITRRPLLCSQPASGEVSTPIRISCRTARGVSPSPQTFSRGNSVFSSSSTRTPCRARWYAVADPPGPAPTTMTSASFSTAVIRASSRMLVKCFTSRSGWSL
ncbi:geranylgeranyl reductase family [Micromonospora sediminicola]|uniref:Geranylgeranyl reductase family n=1 Tax=Micromonospora sediminicola TaxID=946078 RepID=A0A1A9B274_9ACTN|nr:geranylgeranyl reductase family [Micromonospora sediminicola]